MIELRDAVTPATVIARRAAFIREDGRIVDINGIADFSFRNVANGNYHLVIRHRNHIGIRTATIRALNSNALGIAAPALYSFNTTQSQAYQNLAITTNPAQRDLTSGVFGMWGGNGNSDGALRATGLSSQNDYLFLIVALNNNPAVVITNVYNRGDINLDGSIRATGLASVNDYLFLIGALDNNPAKIVNQHQ